MNTSATSEAANSPSGTPGDRPAAAADHTDGAPVHRLGTESAAAQRIALVLDHVLGDDGHGRVPWARIGAAVAVTTGGPYRDDDERDRMLVARIVTVFRTRLRQRGWEVREVPVVPAAGGEVMAVRATARPTMRSGSWGDVGTRGQLARWALRAGRPEWRTQARRTVQALIRPEPSAGAVDEVARIRAREPVWPPPITGARDGGRAMARYSGPPDTVAALRGCLGGYGAPCANAPRGVVRCPRCGSETVCPEPWSGPRLLVCECWPAVCVHPRPPWARAGVAR